ncbi:MAG TPA: S41 family peptidase [Thermoanaerobaculia bacterium]
MTRLLPIVSLVALVAAAPAPAQRERNLADFDFLVAKIAANYAGWDTKVTPATRPQLDALTAELRAKAAAAKSDDELLTILHQWIEFFHDGHTQVGANAAPPPKATNAPVNYPTLPWTEESVMAKLGAKREPLEGVWRMGGGRYRVAVMRNGARYSAVIVSTQSEAWKPGEVKAELTPRADGTFDVLLRIGDHSEVQTTASLVVGGDVLDVKDWGRWNREWPVPNDPDAAARVYPSDALFLHRYSPKTLWLRIPDFNSARAAPLRELIAAHESDLASTPNLIIDLRDNGGGSDFVYRPLEPLLYSRPTINISAEMRASPDNIALHKATAERLKKDAPDVARHMEELDAKMRAHVGEYVPQYDRPFSIDRRDKVLPSPRRIAVLIDNCSSTAEELVLLARQSRKVTLFGRRNSAGVLDFANVQTMPLPSGRYTMQWATSRSMRLPEDPVDPDGIAPDIRIPDDAPDPIRFAAEWLERQVD